MFFRGIQFEKAKKTWDNEDIDKEYIFKGTFHFAQMCPRIDYQF